MHAFFWILATIGAILGVAISNADLRNRDKRAARGRGRCDRRRVGRDSLCARAFLGRTARRAPRSAHRTSTSAMECGTRQSSRRRHPVSMVNTDNGEVLRENPQQ
jgi:hypothetical protein